MTAPSLCRRTLREPLTVAVLLVVGASLVLRIVWPEAVASVHNDKEGGLEHVSHLVLLLTVPAWALASQRLANAPRVLAGALAAYCLLLLVEEIDWGQVYGIDLGYRWLEGIYGRAALHHNQARPATMFHDRLMWFAAPAILWAIASQSARARAWLEPALPSPELGLTFLLALGAYGFTDLLSAGIHNAYQVLAYLVLLTAGLRACRGAETQPAPP